MKRVVSFFAIIGVLVILTGLLIFVNTRQHTVQYLHTITLPMPERLCYLIVKDLQRHVSLRIIAQYVKKS